MASPRVCSIDGCKRSAGALCMCCDKYICVNHLKEHSDLINDQLFPLSNQINGVFDQLSRMSVVESTFFTELDKWRYQAHQIVDEFCDKKKSVFENVISNQRAQLSKELNELRNEVDALLTDQDATKEHIKRISNSIQTLEQRMNHLNGPQYNFSCLNIGDNCITFDERPMNIKETFKSAVDKSIIKVRDPYYSIAANNNHILLVCDSKICLLNCELNLQNETPWNHGELRDTFWCRTLSSYFAISSNNVFIIDETLTNMKACLISNSTDDWHCGTCSNTTLFLARKHKGSSISTYTLTPSIELINASAIPSVCKANDYVHDIASNDITLAVIIGNDDTFKRKFYLFSFETLQILWTFTLSPTRTYYRIRCCSLNNEKWMIINPENSELLQLSSDGKQIQKEMYKVQPRHAVSLSTNLLAIIANGAVGLYKLSS